LAEKLNELICPTCGLKCYTSSAYTRCDGCQTVFYASESVHRLRDKPAVSNSGSGSSGWFDV